MEISSTYTTFDKGDRGAWRPEAERWERCSGRIWEVSGGMHLVAYQLNRIPGKEYWRLGVGHPTHFQEPGCGGENGFKDLACADIILPNGEMVISAREDCEHIPPTGLAVEYISVDESLRKQGVATMLMRHIVDLYKPETLLTFPNSQASVNFFCKLFSAAPPRGTSKLPAGPCGWAGGKPLRMDIEILPEIDMSI